MTGRPRRYSFPGRDHAVAPRFSADEYAELTAAAARVGLTTTGYVGEVALAAARGVSGEGRIDAGAITRTELAQLQRDLFAARTAVNQAAAGLRQAAVPGPAFDDAVTSCVRSVAELDSVIARIHGQLRQVAGPAGDRQHEGGRR